MSNNLKAGEFYGQVPNKRSLTSSVISEIIHKKSVSLPWHSHELAFFSLLIDGSYSETYGRKSFLYRPMTIWWHPSGVSHKDEVGQNGGRFFTVEIQPQGLENLQQFTEVPDDFFEKNTSLVRLAYRLYYEFKNWNICSELIAEGITLEMLAHSARRRFAPEKRPPVWLLRVVEKLNEEFADNLTTKELAAEAKVHQVHLASVFRKFYGETIGEYVQRLRINYASKLLLDKEIPLADIALSAGFSDQSHFTRIFKDSVGTTPGVFRNLSD